MKHLEVDSVLPGLWSSNSGILLTFPSWSQNGCHSHKHLTSHSPCRVPNRKDKAMEEGDLLLNSFSFIGRKTYLTNLLCRLPFWIHCPNLGLMPVPRQMLGKVGQSRKRQKLAQLMSLSSLCSSSAWTKLFSISKNKLGLGGGLQEDYLLVTNSTCYNCPHFTDVKSQLSEQHIPRKWWSWDSNTLSLDSPNLSTASFHLWIYQLPGTIRHKRWILWLPPVANTQMWIII